jgi:hypothetical protein
LRFIITNNNKRAFELLLPNPYDIINKQDFDLIFANPNIFTPEDFYVLK